MQYFKDYILELRIHHKNLVNLIKNDYVSQS